MDIALAGITDVIFDSFFSRQANNLVPRALFLGFGGPDAPPPKPGTRPGDEVGKLR